MTETTTSARPDEGQDPAEHRLQGRRALRAAMFGFFVDMYDVYLPVIALAPSSPHRWSAGPSAPSSSVPWATASDADGPPSSSPPASPSARG
jgi:hypothetical protein